MLTIDVQRHLAIPLPFEGIWCEVLSYEFATELLPGPVRFGIVRRRVIEQPRRLAEGFGLIHGIA